MSNMSSKQAAIRAVTGTAYTYEGDWLALFDLYGIAAGTFNERLLAWINQYLGASYESLPAAQQAYAVSRGFANWDSLNTIVASGALSLLAGETDGLAFDFTDQSAAIIDTGTPANDYSSTGTVSSGALVGPGGKLTYTSPSNKLVMQADGYMKYSAHNLFTYSQDPTNAAWQVIRATKTTGQADPDGGTNAVLVVPNSDNNTHRFDQNVTLVDSGQYRVVVRAKASGYSGLAICIGRSSVATTYAVFNLSAGTSADTGTAVSTITALGDGWYECSVVDTAATTDRICMGVWSDASTQTYVGDTTSGVLIYKCHAHRYPAVTDYCRTTSAAVYSLPYSYSATDGSCEGLLVEEARTNLVLSSVDLSGGLNLNTTDARDQTGITGVANSATSVIENSATGLHNFQNSSAATVAGTTAYTLSCYAKRAGRDVTFRFASARFSDQGATFDLENGTVLQEWNSPTSTSITDVGNGWWRLTVTATSVGAGLAGWYCGLDNSGASSANGSTYAGDSASGIYIEQPQIEAGSFPTSPIITYGSTATRAADNISIATSAFPYQTGDSTVYLEAGETALDNSARFMSMYDGSNNRFCDIQQFTGNLYDYSLHTGSAGTVTIKTSFDLTGFKVAIGLQDNNWSAIYNGSIAATDTTITIDQAATTLAIGGYPAGTNAGAYKLKTLYYVPRRKSDSELQTETA